MTPTIRGRSLTRREAITQALGAATTAGKIRGFAADGVYAFKGVPYAEPAAGERRFMPPVKVHSWTGIRSALIYGPKCPNGIADPTGGDNSARADEDEFLLYRQHGWPRAAEDCLRLNVWTPSTRGGRRPVMSTCTAAASPAAQAGDRRRHAGGRGGPADCALPSGPSVRVAH